MDTTVQVTNLRQFSGALKRVDRELQAALKADLKALAEPIAAEARNKVPRRSGRAAGSIRAGATTRGAVIRAGGKRAPYYHWLDFGGSTGRGHRPGAKWSGSIIREWMGKPVGEGCYVYPAIRKFMPETKAAMGKAIARAGRAAGFEVR